MIRSRQIVLRKDTRFLHAYLIILFLAVIVGPASATTISNISQNASTIGRYQKFEATFTLSTTYSNPFDPCIVDVTVSFHEPDGNVVTIPGFYYRSYTVSGSNPETYTTAGAISWKVRFAPSKPGTHTFDITVKDSGGTVVATNAGSFVCQESGKKGFVRVNPNHPAFLMYDNGDTRVNIGQNIGWNIGGIYGWNNYLTKMHNAGTTGCDCGAASTAVTLGSAWNGESASGAALISRARENHLCRRRSGWINMSK